MWPSHRKRTSEFFTENFGKGGKGLTLKAGRLRRDQRKNGGELVKTPFSPAEELVDSLTFFWSQKVENQMTGGNAGPVTA